MTRETGRTGQTGTDAPGAPSDEALLILYANGDPTAAAALTARLAPRALGQGLRMLGDRAEAEDVVQEAMLRLWKAAPEWRRGEAQPGTWLWRVVANLCTDRLRRRGRDVPLDPARHDRPDGAPTAAALLQEAERRRALEAALAALPDRQRRAVLLRHVEGWSNPAIAAEMDIGVEAVESLTARGKRALARALGPRRADLGYADDRD
ncbi:MAG: RNA polymerase sigma factor [Shimia sp.]